MLLIISILCFLSKISCSYLKSKSITIGPISSCFSVICNFLPLNMLLHIIYKNNLILHL